MVNSRSRAFPVRAVLGALTVLSVLFGSRGVEASSCPADPRLSQSQQYSPPYSSFYFLISTAGNDHYFYGATEWGFVRADLTNPSSPGPLRLIQIGLQYVPESNGGLIPQVCDCFQGAATMAVAEAPDGSSRMISDWQAHSPGVLRGMVAKTTGAGVPEFGSQLNVSEVGLGDSVAALYLPGSGKYFGYFPSSPGVQVVDLTNPSGSTAVSSALNPIGSFAQWIGVNILQAGTVTIGGIPRSLLAGSINGTLRVAEVDASGMPAEKASLVTSSQGTNSLYLANVNGRAYLFSADNGRGLNVYEYTGTALNFAGNIPGYFNSVVVKGNPGGSFPAIFLHHAGAGAANSIDIYDSKWLERGTPTLAYSLPNADYYGNSVEAVVTGSGSQIVAHVYRMTGTDNPLVNKEPRLITDNLDISCIAADTTSPPTASATFSNVSAALRSGAEKTINYYGDRVTLTDNSSTGVALTRVDWDINNAGSPAPFVPDVAAGNLTSVPNIFFPCDPAGATIGNLNTGVNCAASLGLSSTPPNQTFAFAEKSTNPNGPSVNPPPSGVFYSTAIPFVMPQIGIVGFSAGVLRVLSGGNADATPTQGNTADATFLWSFNGAAGVLGNKIMAVPTGATSFSLTVTWAGGYTRTLTGSIVQTDLVPGFSISPNPATTTGKFTLTNTMQKSPTTTLVSVDYGIAAGACSGSPVFSTTLLNFVSTGTQVMDSPSSAGTYCVTLKYNYQPLGQATTNQTVSNPLTVVVQSAASLSCAPTSVAVGTPVTCTATGGSGSATYSWNWGDDFPPRFTAGPNPSSHSFSSGGARTITVSMEDAGAAAVTANFSVLVNGSGPPAPGPSGVAVTVSGPQTGSANSDLLYSAFASGGTGVYTYSWACDYNPIAPGQFTVGSSTNICRFPGNGVHAVAVKVTDSANSVAVNYASTTISGPSLPSAAFTMAGATLVSGSTYSVPAGRPVTFTAAEPNATSWGWVFGDGTLANARTVTKTYSAKGTYAGQLIVTGNGTLTSGSNIATFTVQVVTPPPSGAFTIAGAQGNSDGTVFAASVGDELTLTASEPNATSWGWAFGDDTSGAAKSVQKTYSKVGSYTVQLLVTGRDPDTTGLTISTFTINVVSCAPSASNLCLNDNRFKASVAWSVPPQGKSGAGSGVALTADTGYYWFFTPSNIELVLKVVDGRAFNGKFWVFYGALSNVEYTITVKDTKTGAVKTYNNPYGNTASLADVNAFDPGPGSTAARVPSAATALALSCPSSVTVNTPVSCTVTGASGGATYSWRWSGSFGSSESGGATNSHTYTAIGTQRVNVTVTDGGTYSLDADVAITAPAAGSLVAAITPPTGTGSAGTALTFTGSATGGTSPYSYAWDCNYNPSVPNFTAGTSQNTTTCTYSTAGSRTLALRVTDSATPTPATSVATATAVVSPPVGPGLPSGAFTLDGASLNSATGRYEAETGRQVTFTAAEANAASWGWAFGDGKLGSGKTVTYTYPLGGNYDGMLIVAGDGTHTDGTSVTTIPMAIVPCAGDAKTLCLNGGRFRVRVDWKSQSSAGFGTAVPVTSDTGEFWFLSGNNIEVVLKVVDGTSFNGHFWVFYGALSDFEYTITVTDTTTGAVKTYHNPLGTTASVADVNAF